MPLKHFTMLRPADMHCHFRQGEVLRKVLPATAANYGMAIAMPNTNPPITSIALCENYRAEISRAWPDLVQFRPLMTAYVNENLDPDELRRGFEQKIWVAAKLYPQGGTTNSEHAAASLEAVYPIFEVMQDIGMPLLVHGEVVGPKGAEHSRWERERIFSMVVLPVLRKQFPKLKIVCEHISTAELVGMVMADKSGYTAGTFTPHHAWLTDGDVSRGGVWTDANCMPIIKGVDDRAAIQAAMISGDSRFFAGTDSAPHDARNKYARCCSFGAFVAPGSIEVYAAVFAQHGVFNEPDGVERFEKFMSRNGPDFYGILPAKGKITMVENVHGQKITERFLVPGTKILEPNVEIVPLFHEELGLAPDFPYVVGYVAPYGG